MAEHNETGTKGEELAAAHLESKGYTILEKNWRHKRYELDLIAKHKGLLIIAEVKSRKGIILGEVDEWVTRQKQRNMVAGANAYIEKTNTDLEVRFDIVTVIFQNGTEPKVNHIEDAFIPFLSRI